MMTGMAKHATAPEKSSAKTAAWSVLVTMGGTSVILNFWDATHAAHSAAAARARRARSRERGSKANASSTQHGARRARMTTGRACAAEVLAQVEGHARRGVLREEAAQVRRVPLSHGGEERTWSGAVSGLGAASGVLRAGAHARAFSRTAAEAVRVRSAPRMTQVAPRVCAVPRKARHAPWETAPPAHTARGGPALRAARRGASARHATERLHPQRAQCARLASRRPRRPARAAPPSCPCVRWTRWEGRGRAEVSTLSRVRFTRQAV